MLEALIFVVFPFCMLFAAIFDMLLWGAVQTGRWGTQKQRAGAVDIEAGIQPKILPKLKPWIRGGYYYGSGDKDSAALASRHGVNEPDPQVARIGSWRNSRRARW